jgi:hypothetical protein
MNQTQAPNDPAAKQKDESFEYAKALYGNVIEWYKDVHDRAKQVVTLDGTFITILSGVIVLKGTDLKAVTDALGMDSIVALVVMAVAFVVSGTTALAALIPLWLQEEHIRKKYNELRGADGTIPAPSVMWYSQFIRQMDRAVFLDEARQMTKEYHAKALTSQAHTLSERLARKYRLVFTAFVAAGVAILALLYATGSYMVNASQLPPPPT